MTIVRVSTVGRGLVEAELIEDQGGRCRVRFADSGRVAVVASSRVRGRQKAEASSDDAPAKPPRFRPALPPMTRASELSPPSKPFERGATRAVPKPAGPARSPRYLDFVRTKACLLCGAAAPSHAHHQGPRGMGEKADDYRTIPLCADDHAGFHAGNRPELTRGLVAHAQRELLVEYVRQIEGT